MFCKWLNVSPTIFKSDLFYTNKKSYPIFFTHQIFLPDSFHSKKRFHILWKKMFWNTIRKTQRFKQVWNNILELKTYHYVESVRICSFSGPYFPAFGLHTEIRSISRYSVRMWENTDQKNSDNGHFSGSVFTKPLMDFQQPDTFHRTSCSFSDSSGFKSIKN